jgi:hypothetical protein
LVCQFDLVSSAAGDLFSSVTTSALVTLIHSPLDLFQLGTCSASRMGSVR